MKSRDIIVLTIFSGEVSGDVFCGFTSSANIACKRFTLKKSVVHIRVYTAQARSVFQVGRFKNDEMNTVVGLPRCIPYPEE